VPVCGSIAPTEQFSSGVQEAKIGPDKHIPHVSAPIIVKYVTSLKLPLMGGWADSARRSRGHAPRRSFNRHTNR
jgi:hypothetical protein